MKASDIKVGEEYAAQRHRSRYSPIFRVRVLEVGVPYSSRHKLGRGYVKINDGARVVRLDIDSRAGEDVIPTKGILRPWDEQARINAEREAQQKRRNERDAVMKEQVARAINALAEEGIAADGSWERRREESVYVLRLLPREAASLATLLGMLAKLKKHR